MARLFRKVSGVHISRENPAGCERCSVNQWSQVVDGDKLCAPCAAVARARLSQQQ